MNNSRKVNILIARTPQLLAEQIAGEFTKIISELVHVQDTCSVVLSGGSTPKLFLSRLAHEPYRTQTPWNKLHFFWGDERYVAPNHAQSNYRLAQETLLRHVPVPSDQIHRMPTEQGAPAESAAIYEQQLRKIFDLKDLSFPQFDVIFLGVGTDGHTASLFPEQSTVDEKNLWVIATKKTADATTRLSLTLPVLNNAKHILLAATGSEKAHLIKTIFEPTLPTKKLPIEMIQPKRGTVTWFIDQAAAQELSKASITRYVHK